MKRMSFRKLGGTRHLEVQAAADLERIDALHPARWAATSAPLRDLHCDAAFLDYIDPHGTGRIRVSQIVAARDWLFERLAGRGSLARKSSRLRLEDLDPGSSRGRLLRQAAEHVLEQLGAADRDGIDLEQVRVFRAGYAQTLANGDGIVPPEAISEPEVAGLVRDILLVTGGAMDASGQPGVGRAELEHFLERGRSYLAWKARPETEAGLLSWGAETAAAARLVRDLDPKLEEHFWICDLMRQEAVAVKAPGSRSEAFEALRWQGSEAIARHLRLAPMAEPQASGQLPLEGPVNPVYEERFEALRSGVLRRVLREGATELTRASWAQVKALFEPYFAWQAARPKEPFEALGEAPLEGLLQGRAVERLRSTIAVDEAAAAELGQIADLEKLILYQRWLIELANNFVNFTAIYHPRDTALVEMGTLIVDGRSLEFCVKVEDRESHKRIAAESLLFLVYATITAEDQKQPAFEILAPVTSGDRGRLRAGKRGLFIDVHNQEWDARIVEVVENPISLVEALQAPFRRAWGFVKRKAEALAGGPAADTTDGREQRPEEGMEVEAAVPGLPNSPPTIAKAVMSGGRGSTSLQGLLLGGGVAFAAIGSTLAYVISALAQLSLLRVLAVLAGLCGLVVLLSGLFGWLKLRRRDMAPLLEANGWAVNARMRLTRRLERLFTRVPMLPRGAGMERPGVLGGFLDQELTASRRQRRGRRLALWGLLLALGLAAAGLALRFGWLRP